VIAELQKKEILSPFDIAVVHVGLGDYERAMSLLEQAEAEFNHNMLWINVDYRLDELRNHPRFPALVKAVGL